MVINGNVFGVTVIGNVSAEQIKRFAELAETITLLRKQLAELFDERLAEIIVQRLGNCSATLENGDTPTELQQHLEALHAMGLIGKCEQHTQQGDFFPCFFCYHYFPKSYIN